MKESLILIQIIHTFLFFTAIFQTIVNMHKSSGNTASNGTTPPKKSRVNSSASQMIVNWINILFSGLPSEHLPAPLKSLKDLRDGVVYTKLTIDVVNRHFTDFGEIYRQMPELANDSAKRYECITGVFSSHLGVTAGVDFDAAIEGNELELAKVSIFIIIKAQCSALEKNDKLIILLKHMKPIYS